MPRLDADDVLAACARLADAIPFYVLDRDGAIRHASDGARQLGGGRLVVEDCTLEVGAERLEGDLSPLLDREWRGEPARYLTREGRRAAFRVHSLLVPPEEPAVVLLRLDPYSLSLAEPGGMRVRPWRSFADASDFHGLLTRSSAMRKLFAVVQRVAAADVTVLVRGESGTGKEAIARALHALSPRSGKPFVSVSCAALTATLLESELFGHVRGAFTGAVGDRRGMFERADGGSLFLDEVAELPVDLQAKLLRVLQERSFTPVGGTRAVEVDVRVISATHQSLRRAVAEGRFREDLMFRLRVVPLFLPPLRERREDIELLVSHNLERAGASGRHAYARVHPVAMRALLDHPWTGNVRELQNAMEYASVVGVGDSLTIDELPPEFREGPLPPPRSAPPASAGSEEAARIRAALDETGGHQGRAAELLGMHRSTLWRKLRTLGIRGPFRR